MSAKKVHHLMTTTASPGRKVSSPGKQPSPQARAAARRYATVLAGRIGMAVTRVAGLAARVGTHSNVDWPVVLAFAAASMVGGLPRRATDEARLGLDPDDGLRCPAPGGVRRDRL